MAFKSFYAEKCQCGQEILVLVITKQGLAFNIPTYHLSFFDFLYGLVKLNIKQATAKIKNKDGVFSIPTPQKLNLLAPSLQPLCELVGPLNPLNTPILDLDNTDYGPALPTQS